ncbi:uncharacterized protein FYW61_019600 [Anableps anableps]
MAAYSVLTSLPEEHFRCSICLDLFTEPVTTPCGHNFCRTCLSQQWSDNEFYQCPKCNKRFVMKPEFSTNEVIAEMSVQIKRRKIEALESTSAPWQVMCDLCADLRFKASKSCLVCLASYCDGHLEPHQRVPALMRHKLVDPVDNLEERVCEKHARILEFFCRRERVCICLLCCETEHRDHETVPVEEEGALQKVKADKETEDSEKLFSNLMGRVQEIQSKLRSNMDEKLRKAKEKVQAMIQELEEEITALQRKHSQLEELLQSEDHLQLLRTLQTLNAMSETKDWSKTKVYADLCIQTVRRAMDHLMTSFQTELKTLTNIELTRIRQYKETVIFDNSTAGAGLIVLEYGKRLKFSKQARSPSLELERPRNVGIYLDYEEGRVSFYDLRERLHIHSYIGEGFTGKVFPYFYLLYQTLSLNLMSTPPGCCICLDEFISPASLPCGHSFCLECIGEYWRISESCQCPLCMVVFPKRPQLQTEQMPQTENETEPLKAGEVPCDFCPAKRAAVRSCLVCLASYCTSHLEPHYQREDLGRHLLVSVAKNLEDSVCRLHGRKLERFCRSDRSCICTMCAKTEHRGHHIVSINKEAAKNKNKLKRKQMKLQQEIQEKLSVAGEMKLTASLHGELPAELWVQTKKLVKQLEEEISELQERSAELEQLSKTEDNLHFLQQATRKTSNSSVLIYNQSNSIDMTSITKSTKDDCFLERHLTCPICMETFIDPVTTSCGHSFCKKCLELSISSCQVDEACPLCKTYLRKAPKVNNVLRDIVQEMKNELSYKFTGAAGEVPCDVCTVPKMKAEKSCLVCLTSFCSTHLENHYSAKRLKGHRLVEPVENLDTRACPTHGCPLELYCRKRQTCVCARCLDGNQEEIVSAEEEWQKKKDQIENTKAELLQRIITRKEKIDEINEDLNSCKRYPSLSVQDDMKDWTYIELDTTLSFGSMRKTTTTMTENIQQQLEKLATIVDVRLDPDTAHPRLFFSDDGSKMKDRGENQEVADSPKRFDVLGSILGLNSLTTGKSYWEVEISNITGWDLGVARGSANRRGRPTLNPDNGYWVLVHFEECDVPKPFTTYAVMTAPPISISLKDKPNKVGVFVDYEEGLVSFYDVTAQSHIYSFSKCSFQDELYPYFSLHMKYEINFDPLIISKIKHTEMNYK